MKKRKISYSKKIVLSLLAIVLPCGAITSNVIYANDDETVITNSGELEETVVEKGSIEKNTIDEITLKETEVSPNTLEEPRVLNTLMLEEDVTTMEEAFPDMNFRTYVGKTVLSNPSYNDDIDKTNSLSASDIMAIKSFKTMTVDNLEISSLKGIEHFESLGRLYCSYNNLTELDLTRLTELWVLNCSHNNLSSIDVKGLEKLQEVRCYYNNLTKLDFSASSDLNNLHVYHNPNLSDLKISEDSKSKMKNLYYHFTKIDYIDLVDFSSLANLTVTKSTNANLSQLTSFYVSGSRLSNGQLISITRVNGIKGFILWDQTTKYYIINPNMSSEYRIAMYYQSDNGSYISMNSTYLDLTQGGLMDNEGNIIVGAEIGDVINGIVILKNGGTVVTGDATYTFDDYTEIGEKNIVTNGNVEVAKNTTDGLSITIGGNIQSISGSENNQISINLDGSNTTTTLPSGSTITNNDGSIIYVVEDLVVSDDIILSGSYITVPNGTSTTNNGDGTVTIPENMVVTIDGEDTVYPGEIIFDTATGKTEYVPISGLITKDESNGINLGDGISEESLKKAEEILDLIPDGKLKNQLEEIVNTVKDMLDVSKKVNDMYDADGNLKDTVTEGLIKDTEKLVNNLPDGPFKDELKDKVDDAKNILNQRNEEAAKEAVDNLFNKDKTDLGSGVGQTEINEAQKKVDKLPNSDKKNELQKEIDKAKDMLDAKDAVNDLFNPDGSIKDGITQDDIKNALDLVNNLADGSLKDELLNLIKEVQKAVDERTYVVLESFAVFTGKGNVSARIDAPVENFSKVYVNGKELDKSNYEVTSGSTVITLKESYLLTLENKTYDVEVEFVSGAKVSIPLIVNVKDSSPSKAPSGNLSVTGGATTSANAVNTGDLTNVNILYGLLAISLLGVVVIIKRRKEIN